MSFKYSPFSKKQLMLLTWWAKDSKVKNMDGIIAHGAVRSGKTIIMGLSFIIWAMQKGTRLKYGICGKTVGSTKRNIIEPLVPMLRMRGYKVLVRDERITISCQGKVNVFYVFGGRDESSSTLIQGVTLAGVLLDEVALMPRSFVEQAIARCSVSGSKLWFNCNPEGPRHWFKTEWVDKAEEKKMLKLHFLLTDNPSLEQEVIDKYNSMFTGIFYKRFILGEWAFADGVIYSNIPETTFYTNENRNKVLPIRCIEKDEHPIYAADYGTVNPMVYLEMYKVKRPDSPIPYFYVDNEYCWDTKNFEKTGGMQKDDSDYVYDFYKFISDDRYRFLIIDPSAESLEVAHRKHGTRIIKAKNSVRPGISMVATLFTLGHIFINKDNCPNLVAELGLYIWDKKKAEAGKEEPIKTNDHSCDTLRYGIFTTTTNFEVFGMLKGIENGRK